MFALITLVRQKQARCPQQHPVCGGGGGVFLPGPMARLLEPFLDLFLVHAPACGLARALALQPHCVRTLWALETPRPLAAVRVVPQV
jgi:hypothetical protein